MVHAARTIWGRYPNIKMVIYLDRNEAAFKQALKMRNQTNIKYCVPCFDGLQNNTAAKIDDFNDLVSACGQQLEFVRKQLKNLITIDLLPVLPSVAITMNYNSEKEGVSIRQCSFLSKPFVYIVNSINIVSIDYYVTACDLVNTCYAVSVIS